MESTLYFVHDPMCSWCWGYRPTWQRMKKQLPENVKLVYLVGGLAPDSDVPMPQDMREGLQRTWQRISTELHVEFNFDFWTLNEPRRSTYPACRAVLTADLMNGTGEEMISAIQHAYYLQAKNPSNLDVLQQLAIDIGLDGGEFISTLTDTVTEARFQKQLKFARKLPISGFPSLVLAVGDKIYPITLDYLDETRSLDDIRQKLKQ